jgi:hypothetical protein
MKTLKIICDYLDSLENNLCFAVIGGGFVFCVAWAVVCVAFVL